MEHVTFTTDDGARLEGELRMPETAPRGSAVLCHPHPRHGGSKDHPLLWAIRNELAASHGLAVLGFNFRGVMGSTGTYGGGRDEIRDAVAAIGTVRATLEHDLPTILIGWSFGANVAVRAAIDDRRVAALVLIGLPLVPDDLSLPPLPDATDLRALRRPALLLAGEHDTFAPAEELRAYAEHFPHAEATIVAGTDHYFWRRERKAAGLIGAFAERVLTPA
ncbi:MAG: alpha/beta fold hydrolase [Actinomycetota bacterium]